MLKHVFGTLLQSAMKRGTEARDAVLISFEEHKSVNIAPQVHGL